MPPPQDERGGLARFLTAPFAMLAALGLAFFAYYASGQSTVGSPSPSAANNASSVPISDAEASILPSSAAGSLGTPSKDASLSFGPFHFAGHANYVYRDNVTAVQIVVTDTSSTEAARFITAFANGNTGALTYFHPLEKEGTAGVTLKPGFMSVHHAEDGQRGVVGELTLNGDVTLGLTLLGSVRTLRDYIEEGHLNDIFNVSLGGYGDDEVWLTRRWINGSTVQYLGLFAADNNTRLDPRPNDQRNLLPSVNITRVDKSKNSTIRFESTFNFTATTPATPHTPMRGLGMDELFSNDTAAGDADILKAIRGPGRDVVDQLAFLAYESEFLAGGWRFLTYFGRDTLLAMQVLLPVLSPQACEGILAGVIQRTGPGGELCHEETIGDYASFLNMKEGHPERGNTPDYDYKMADTDFLLLPALSGYAERYPERARKLMARNSTLVSGSFGALVQRNADRVLRLSAPFGNSTMKSNMIALSAWPLGNWRDSAAGNGWGSYPFDVNCAMVPAALRAISSLAGSLLPSSVEYAEASKAADVWEQHGCAHFALPITPAEASTRVASYVAAANLTSDLLYGAGSLNTSHSHSNAGWNDPTQIVSQSTLYALSLYGDQTPIPVQHSDLAFALLYSPTLPPSLIQAVIEALQPYPRGLLTNVGMVVANAAYDPNPASVETFSNRAYHGAVAWSWQQAYMAAGLERQLKLCNSSTSTSTSARPEWCTTLAPALKQAQTRLWDAIAGSESVLWTEVWTPVLSGGKFVIGDLGKISSDGSEGDAVQLWSYAFLALRDARTGRPVAEGFE